MKNIRGAAQIALIMAVLTLGSKLLGFVREIFMAGYYGTSYIVDTLNIAASIPDMIFAGILGATATSFIPLFSQKYEREGQAAANLFTSQLLNILIVVSILSGIVGMIFSKQIVTLFTMPETSAPSGSDLAGQLHWFLTHGWIGERAQLASFYVRVTFSYCLFTTVGSILESYLKYKNIFITPLIAGYFINLSSISFILLAFHSAEPRLLVFGGFVGTALRTVVVCALAARKNFRYKLNFRMTDTVRRILVLAVPVFLGSTVSQINAFVNKTLASGLITGSIAALGYAYLVVNLLSGMTTTIITTILYPKMAKAYALSDEKRFSELFTTGLTLTIIIGAPFTLGSLLYSNEAIQIIYERGAFGSASTSLTSAAFFFYAFGIVFAMMNNFMASALYSRHNTKTPLAVGAVAMIVNVASNLILVRYLAHGGLALGFSIAALCNVVLLLIIIRRRYTRILQKGFARKSLKLSCAAVLAVGASFPFYLIVQHVFAMHAWLMPRMVLLGLTVLLAAALYLLLLRLLKVKELGLLRQMFSGKL